MAASDWLTHPLLESCGVAHGFGLRRASEPPGLLRPRQVHGIRVAEPVGPEALDIGEADAVVSCLPAVAVGVVTADCVPVLVACASGSAVAAIHAGWRGLAGGVVEAGIARLQARSAKELCAVIGPHIGPCCYEVDAPVLTALDARFGSMADMAVSPSRPGHGLLDLAMLVREDLQRAGLEVGRIATLENACTSCHCDHFHSHRRDGVRSGRLIHHIAAAG